MTKVACGRLSDPMGRNEVKPEQALYEAFEVKHYLTAFFTFFIPVSLFDLESRFFVPTRALFMAARAGAVKVGRRTNLSECSGHARPHLDGSEHDGTLGAVGMAIRGELAFGRGSIAPQPCIRWARGPEP